MARGHCTAESLDLSRFPSLLAAPLYDYYGCSDEEPILKLWHACYYIELILRVTVAIGLAELRNQGPVNGKLLGDLKQKIDWPTLGKWQGMAELIAKPMLQAENVIVPELYHYVLNVIKPLLDGRSKSVTPETSLLALRNKLAHGGLTRDLAIHLYQNWRDRIEQATFMHHWLQGIALVIHDGSDLITLFGPTIKREKYQPANPALASKLQDFFCSAQAPVRTTEEVVLVRGSSVLSLWPWAIFGQPRVAGNEETTASDNGESLLQMYARRGETLLEYEPFGSSRIYWSVGGLAELKEFEHIFPGDKGKAHQFENDIRSDAKKVVGRVEQLQLIRTALDENHKPVLWFHGHAGVGKSFLLARLIVDLLDEAEHAGSDPQRLIIPYRFKVGQEGCSRADFLAFAVKRLTGWLHLKPGTPCTNDGLTELLTAAERAGRSVLLILDGLDEIEDVEQGFAENVPLSLGPHFKCVTWLCAGRSEVKLPFEQANCCRILFSREDGLPGISDEDVRTMLVDPIGKKRNQLLLEDKEEANKLFSIPWTHTEQFGFGQVHALLRQQFEKHNIALGPAAIVEPNSINPWFIVDAQYAVYYIVHIIDAQLSVYKNININPFIQEVIKKSEGLPLYVQHVVGDIRASRISALDEAEGKRLPSGLAEYQEALLRRCTLGVMPKILTPLISLIAVAKEPLSWIQLTNFLNDPKRRLVHDHKEVQGLLEEALRRLSPMLRHRHAENGVGYTVYHHSLRERMYQSPCMKDSVKAELAWLCEEKCMRQRIHHRDPFKIYVLDHGISHLIESERYSAAVQLLVRMWENNGNVNRQTSVEKLDAFARKISVGLRDMLNALHDPKTEKVRRIALKKQAKAIDPEKLAYLLKRFYEIEPLKYGIRLLIEYHAEKWSRIRDKLISPDDMVFRYTVGEALADLYWESGKDRRSRDQSQFDAIIKLTRHSNINHREVGCYALRFIFSRTYRDDISLINKESLEALGSSDFYVERMILGELLVDLALQGAEVSKLVTAQDFWHPIWDYHKLDILDLGAIEHLKGSAPNFPQTHAFSDFQRAYNQFSDVEARRTDLLQNLNKYSFPIIVELLTDYYTVGLFPSRIRSALDELNQISNKKNFLDIVKLFFMHPLWSVAEAMASVLASMAADDRSLLMRVSSWIEVPDTPWRIRYGVLDFAFDIRHLDNYELFIRAIRFLYADPSCRIRGACANDLTGWILNCDVNRQRDLLRQFAVEIRYWVRHADDCWLLDELYSLCSVLHRNGCEVELQSLLVDGMSPYLNQRPPFYSVGRDQFLANIERKRRDYNARLV